MENQVLDNDLLSQQAAPEKAGFWIRVGATLIDFLAYLPLVGLNFYNFFSLKSLPLQLVVTLILFLYKPFMEFKYGATLGKMAVKIKVVSENYGNITLSQAISRYIPWIISQAISLYSTILLFQHPDFAETTGFTEVTMLQNEVTPTVLSYLSSGFLFISVLFVAFNDKKQGLHDMIAKTYCVYK